MENLIAGSFDRSADAFAALSKLDELDDQGLVSLREGAVVERSPSGELVVPAGVHPDEHSGLKAVTGGLIGMVVGVLGGPVGVMLGGIVGGTVGAAVDLSPLDEDDGLLAQYARHVQPGTAAILAHVDELEDEPVDSTIRSFGGRVLRQPAAAVQAELASVVPQ
jgi:uncharacterized membrane protein